MFNKFWACIVATFCSITLAAQLPSSLNFLEGNVIEFTSDSGYHFVPNVSLIVNNEFNVLCDREGNFSLRIPFVSEKLNLEVEDSAYEIIQPKDGSHFIDAKIEPNTKYNLLIVLISANLDEGLRLEIGRAQDEIERLKAKNTYTDLRLQKLNRQLLDSIKSFQDYQASFQKQLSFLEATAQVDQDSISTLNSTLDQMSKERALLIGKLSQAMEEKYLRQKASFDDISTHLRLYLTRAKDLRDHLEILESIIKTNSTGNYSKALSKYGEIYEELEANKDDYLNSIAHYWSHDGLPQEFATLESFLFEEIHKAEFLSLNGTVNKQLRDASEGRGLKLKSIKKEANKSVTSLDKKLPQLEKQVDHLLEKLVIF